MLKKALILVLTGIMIFSSFAILASDMPVSAHSYNMNPAIPPAGYLGNVTVLPDGTVTGTGSGTPMTVSGNVYSLTENVTGTVIDQMNGSTINGNGFTVNGGSYAAVIAGNVTGITVENLVIVNAYEGVQFNHVFNSVVDNVTINDTNAVAVTMAHVYYSGNVTIKNSNFQLGSTSTYSYGIYAEYDSAVNVSFNNFTGAIKYPDAYFYGYSVGLLNAWGNNIKSINSSADAFDFEDGGNAVFAGNYINNTDDAIYVEYGQSTTSMNNYISNSSYSYELYEVSSFSSYNDTVIFSEYPLYLEWVGNTYIQDGNFNNTTSGSSLEYCNYVTITHSTFSTNTTNNLEYLIDSEYGMGLNLTKDQLIGGSSPNAEAVYADYMSGWVNLANDYIYAPNGYGLYMEYSPQFNVTNSYFNTSYGIYVSFDYAIVGATISGNTFAGQNTNYAAYLYVYDFYNFNFSNNVVQSPDSNLGAGGIYVYVDGGVSSNIIIASNTIINNKNPIYLHSDSENSASNARIQNNTIANSSDAIYVYYYYNAVITGNTIINASVGGIYVDAESSGVNVSYNLIENLPGFGQMSYGIQAVDLYGGNNIISHNTILNPGSSTYDISINDSDPVLIYSNTVNGGAYGIYSHYNSPVEIFDNTIDNANYGIYSHLNENFSYYSNTVDNANYSFYSYDDYGGSIFANTFSDSQANSPQLYFLDIGDYTAITLYHNNFLNSTTNSITYNSFYDASGPLFMNDLLPVGGNYWSNYTGTGTNGIGNTPMNLGGTVQDLYPLTSMWTGSTVTFVETGLASGTSWWASLGGSQKSSTGTTIVFSESNGQYMNVGYEIGSVAGYTLSVSSGSVNENGASNTVTITFTPIPATQYKVTFAESGLPNGTSWSVTLNGNTEASSTGSIAFNEANGIYGYSLGAVNGYHLASNTGTITVNGNQQTVSVNFVPNTYTLTVVETGLPAGNYWNFTLNGQNYSTNSTILTMSVTAGNYSFNVSGPIGYSTSPQSSNVTVNGSNTTVFVHFSAQKATPAATSGTSKVLEGLGIGVLIMVIIGTMGSFLMTGKFPWDLIRKK